MLRAILLAMGFPQAETVALMAGGHILLQPFGAYRRLVSPAEFERWLTEQRTLTAGGAASRASR